MNGGTYRKILLGHNPTIRSRFTGSTKKGKAAKRAAAFNGPGKISVSRSTNPKHGFDHGIRSRVCLEFSDDRVVSVEGTFLDGKLVSGIDFSLHRLRDPCCILAVMESSRNLGQYFS